MFIYICTGFILLYLTVNKILKFYLILTSLNDRMSTLYSTNHVNFYVDLNCLHFTFFNNLLAQGLTIYGYRSKTGNPD